MINLLLIRRFEEESYERFIDYSEKFAQITLYIINSFIDPLCTRIDFVVWKTRVVSFKETEFRHLHSLPEGQFLDRVTEVWRQH